MKLLRRLETQLERQIPAQPQATRHKSGMTARPSATIAAWPCTSLSPRREMGRLRQECRRQVSAADAFGRAGIAKRHAGTGRPVDAHPQWAYRIDGQLRPASCQASQ